MLASCAEITVAKEDAISFGKNLNALVNGFDKISMPSTTVNESIKPTQNSSIGLKSKIIIAEIETDVKGS